MCRVHPTRTQNPYCHPSGQLSFSRNPDIILRSNVSTVIHLAVTEISEYYYKKARKSKASIPKFSHTSMSKHLQTKNFHPDINSHFLVDLYIHIYETKPFSSQEFKEQTKNATTTKCNPNLISCNPSSITWKWGDNDDCPMANTTNEIKPLPSNQLELWSHKHWLF